MSQTIRGLRAGAAVLALVGLGSCKSLDVPNYSSASVDLLETSPTPSIVNTTAVGLLTIFRGATTANIDGLDILGRNSYILDPSEVRNVNIPLQGPYDQTQAGFSAATWPYGNVRDVYVLLHALDKVPTGSTSTQMTDAQKKGVSGVAKTLLAYLFHGIIRQTDVFGAPIDVDHPRSDPLAPFASKAAVYTFIETTLDDADADLAAAGTAFSFAFTPGFTSNAAGGANPAFNTPAGFRQINRAIKARVLADQGKWAAVLTALAGTWINPTTATYTPALTLAQLNAGPYNIYTTITGDATNGLFDATGRARLAHPSVLSDARATTTGTTPCTFGAGGNCDDRLVRKVTPRTGGQLTVLNHSSSWRFTVYNALDASVPIFRNEELLLLRAEANLACTGVSFTVVCSGNRAAALADINTIRVASGKLPQLLADPGPDLGSAPAANSNQIRSGDLLLDELLYNKRYSLIYEYGHRWVDLRKYGMLNLLPHDQPGDLVFTRRPVPDTECSQRTTETIAGCATGASAVPGV